jgi:hypothetical protein
MSKVKSGDIDTFSLTNFKSIQESIFEIRGIKVIVDRDLAKLYGVSTKRLNEQVQRNESRFPEDFMFKLTKNEKLEVVAKCDHLNPLKFSTVNPNVFTEYGALMLASVLNSEVAIKVCIEIIRVFSRMRRVMFENIEMNSRIGAIEEKIKMYDENFESVFELLRKIIKMEDDKKPVGFQV